MAAPALPMGAGAPPWPRAAVLRPRLPCPRTPVLWLHPGRQDSMFMHAAPTAACRRAHRVPRSGRPRDGKIPRSAPARPSPSSLPRPDLGASPLLPPFPDRIWAPALSSLPPATGHRLPVLSSSLQGPSAPVCLLLRPPGRPCPPPAPPTRLPSTPGLSRPPGLLRLLLLRPPAVSSSLACSARLPAAPPVLLRLPACWWMTRGGLRPKGETDRERRKEETGKRKGRKISKKKGKKTRNGRKRNMKGKKGKIEEPYFYLKL
ncbi:hypothetical protein PVAP13_9KG275626 [Panicum virgatum]|uniref:Uncharacterized protein n=1 Tax=Panicum virgatum TaxID=38727 RepID=A0A8T0NKC0_PANVG|nr:hypothetical protein PVAP13_9KG275626 [Panicum virgatum]